MNIRVVSTHVHGIVGSIPLAVAFAGPRLLGIEDVPASARALRLWGAGAVAYTALTDFELGVVKVLPMPAHLALDVVGALALSASPWVSGYVRTGRRYWLPHALIGIAVILLALITRTQPSYKRTG